MTDDGRDPMRGIVLGVPAVVVGVVYILPQASSYIGINGEIEVIEKWHEETEYDPPRIIKTWIKDK